MALHICVSLPSEAPCLQYNGPKSCPVPKTMYTISLPKASLCNKKEAAAAAFSFCWSKRKLAILSVVISGSLLNIPNTNLALEMEKLERYTDAKEGFTLLRPSSYVKVVVIL